MGSITAALLTAFAWIACDSGPAGTTSDGPFPVFPTEVESDTILFFAELDTRTMPAATPTSPFYWLTWSARNTTIRPVLLDYCWLGVRMYRGSRVVWEDPTYPQCALPHSDDVVPGAESSIGTAGMPDFFLRNGVPEGRLLLTVRWQLSGMVDTLEIQAGEVELLENNGLTPPEEPGAETKLFVSGRARTQSGDPVSGFVGVRVHGDDCARYPALWETTFTEVAGDFEHEATLQEGIFDACVTVLVQPYDSLQGAAKVVEAGRLRLRKPSPTGEARDSLRVEVVF